MSKSILEVVTFAQYLKLSNIVPIKCIIAANTNLLLEKLVDRFCNKISLIHKLTR